MTKGYSFLTKNVVPTINIKVKKAAGILIKDFNNKEYIDFSSQTLNLSLGNSPQIVKKAFLKQFNKYSFLSTRFISDVFITLSKKLVQISPSHLTKVNIKLTNGSDANESAIKRARIYRKKPYIVSFSNSHIGETSETLNASKQLISDFYGGSNRFIYISPPFIQNNTEAKTLKKLEEIFRNRKDIAAIIIEPIIVNVGVQILSKEFLKNVRALCNKFRITLIFDEIQTAFGWIGEFFASKYFDVEPDMLTMGKALACGFPLSGILMKKEYDVIDYGLDEFTYGGHSISCAIALENIKLLSESNLLKNVKKKSLLFKSLLIELKQKHNKIIKEIRICGLIVGIEFYSFNKLNYIFNTLLKNGLIVRKTSEKSNSSLILKPPIIVNLNTLKKAVSIMDKVLKSL